MATTKRVDKFINKSLKSFGTKALNYWFKSPKARRITFLSSLVAYYHDPKSEKLGDYLHKANQQMQIAGDDGALTSPAMLASVIWTARCPDKDAPLKTQADRIIRNVPEWMKYADEQSMRKDIERIWTFIHPEKVVQLTS